MTTVTSLGVDQLSLRGSGTDYNILSRFFATKAQADAALADSSWVPTAGKTNGCITGDQGILVYDFGTSALVVADAATRSYVDTEVAAAVAALVDSAPGTLDTLNELAAAINDDANAFTTLQNAINAVQADVDQNESDADAAIAAVQADVDQNESDADAAIAAVQADVDQNESDADAAIAAVQADVDQNESDSDAADAALSARLDVLEADPTTATAVAAVQADVDQNESDADAAIALKADIASPTFTGTPAAPTAGAGTNTTQLATTAFVTTAVANVIDSAPGALDTLNELAAALGDDANFATTITNSIAAVQADVDQNEVDGDAADAALSGRLDTLEADPTTASAVALKADLASPALTGTPTAPTAAADTNTTQIATTAYVQTELSDLIGDAPAGLDTLGEIADALNDDVAALSNVTTLVNANETHVDNLATLTGVAKDSVNLGTFTGSTITDSVVIKVALQELETEVETKLASSSVSAYGATLVDDADAATARTTLGLGTAATTASTDYATAAQGTTADAALPATSVSAYGLTLIDDADASAARTTLGLDASTVRTILGITENNGDPADGRGMYYDTGASKYLLSS